MPGKGSDQKPPLLLKGTILATIVVAPLAIGTVHTWTRAVVFALAALALGLALWSRRRHPARGLATVPLLALGVAFAATLLQLVPLPPALIELLSPRAHEIFTRVLGDYGARPITLDVGGTVAELAKIGAYAAFFLGTMIYASRSHRRRAVLVTVILVADVCGVIGLLQALAGSQKILFFYDTNAVEPAGFFVRGPFVNPNHFGALVGLAAPVALVLGMREPSHRAFAYASLLFLNVCIVFSLSRSTMISAPLAQLLAFVLERRATRGLGSRRPDRHGEARVVAAIGIAAALALSTIALWDRLAPELRHTRSGELSDPLGPTSKLSWWRDGVELAATYPWLGHGRGAFEQAFPQVHENAGLYRSPYLENGYIQAASDWGAPVTALLFVLAGWSLWRALGRLRADPILAGPIAALVGLALHDTVDFAADIPGVGLPALALLAVTFGRPTSTAAEDDPAAPSAHAHERALLLAPLVPVGAFLASLLLPTADSDSRALVAMAKAGASRETIVAEGERLSAAHPADYFVPALVARELAADGDLAALKWLNRSMFLNPKFAPPHLVAAELLASRGNRHKAQALVEFKLAAAGLANSPDHWARVARHYPAVEDLLAACPDDPAELHQLGRYLQLQKRPADAEIVYSKALQLDPEHLELRRGLVGLAISLKKGAVAVDRARGLVSRQPTADSQALLARALILDGQLGEADKVYDHLRGRGPEVFTLGIELALAHVKAQQLEQARKRLDSLAWARSQHELVTLHRTRAAVERAAGNSKQADWEETQAARIKRESP